MKLERLRAALARYLELFPHERERLREFTGFLDGARDWAEASSRKTARGHLTASAMVVAREGGRALLVRHLTLGRWLQPGGHLEDEDDTPRDGALREVREETPVAHVTYLPVDTDPEVPVDLDSHAIPGNPSKREGPHLHHDIRFVFLIDEISDTAPEGEWGWHDLAELERGGSDLSRLAGKARRLAAGT